LEVEEKYDINDIQLRIRTIQELYHTEMFNKIINSSNRVMNLSKNSQEIEINVSLFKKQEEVILWKQYEKCNNEIQQFISKKQYHEVYKMLEKLSIFVDEFFEEVLVMDKDEDIRKNRIGLIKKLSILFNHAAALSKICQKGEG